MIEKYNVVRPGHWHQVERTGPGPVYSNEYMNYYNKIGSDKMSMLRYGMISRHIGSFNSICDIGYGNGSFLTYCHMVGRKTYGYDVSDYPVPSGVTRLNKLEDIDVDVTTFFDSLEHFEQEDLVPILKNLKTRYVIVSAPWFHEHLASTTNWFETWKHRKPNEHFHHFDVHGLVDLLKDSGFSLIHVGNNEDEIRKGVDHRPNILTVIGERL